MDMHDLVILKMKVDENDAIVVSISSRDDSGHSTLIGMSIDLLILSDNGKPHAMLKK